MTTGAHRGERERGSVNDLAVGLILGVAVSFVILAAAVAMLIATSSGAVAPIFGGAGG